MLIGTLRSFGQRGFGIVSCRRQDGKIENYFMVMKNVQFCEPAEPHVGCIIHFDVDSSKPVPVGKYPLCQNVQVFSPAPVVAGSAAVTAALSAADAQSEAK